MTDFSFKDDAPDAKAAPDGDASTRATASPPSASPEAQKVAPIVPSPPLPPLPPTRKAQPQNAAAPVPSPPLPQAPQRATTGASSAQPRDLSGQTQVPSPPLPATPQTSNAGSQTQWEIAASPAAVTPATSSRSVTNPAATSTQKPATPKAPGASPPPDVRVSATPASTRATPNVTATTQPKAPTVKTLSPVAPTPKAPANPAAKPDKGMPATGELARNQMKTSAREYVEAKPTWRTYLDHLDPVASWISMASIVVGALCILYLLYAIFDGQIGGAIGNQADTANIISKISIALHMALIALSLGLIILMFDVTLLGPGLALLGLALFFGSAPAVKAIGHTQATGALALQMIEAGKWLLTIGLLKYSLNVAAWLAELPNRMKRGASVGIADLAEPAQQRTARHATMFSPCWQLPFCREVIRKQCPAYIARKRCWKFGRGCYCDEEMISRIIRGESADVVKAPTRMSRQGKPPCGRCYIFLEHQSLKYKSLAWLAIPATALLAFLGWPFYTQLFTIATSSVSNLWARLSFSRVNQASTRILENVPGQADLSQYQLTPEQMQAAAQGMFGVILGFFLLIYISKFIEWAIYKAKW